VTLVGGRVEVSPDPYRSSTAHFRDASDVTAPELAAIDRHLAAWPDGYASLAAFLDQFWPKRAIAMSRGSCSGHHALDETCRVTNVMCSSP
jgi:hypothetical protein